MVRVSLPKHSRAAVTVTVTVTLSVPLLQVLGYLTASVGSAGDFKRKQVESYRDAGQKMFLILRMWLCSWSRFRFLEVSFLLFVWFGVLCGVFVCLFFSAVK